MTLRRGCPLRFANQWPLLLLVFRRCRGCGSAGPHPRDARPVLDRCGQCVYGRPNRLRSDRHHGLRSANQCRLRHAGAQASARRGQRTAQFAAQLNGVSGSGRQGPVRALRDPGRAPGRCRCRRRCHRSAERPGAATRDLFAVMAIDEKALVPGNGRRRGFGKPGPICDDASGKKSPTFDPRRRMVRAHPRRPNP